MRRMASAAAAKKWPRLFQLCTLSVSTRRTKASWTSAVASSVCPGFSWASLRPPDDRFPASKSVELRKRPAVRGILGIGRAPSEHRGRTVPAWRDLPSPAGATVPVTAHPGCPRRGGSLPQRSQDHAVSHAAKT
jgi:hypothetical protein